MMMKLCDVSSAAVEKLPALTDDKSGIGVHFVDAYIKPMNAALEDGTRVKCQWPCLKLRCKKPPATRVLALPWKTARSLSRCEQQFYR
jgi:hypothetical protein